MTEELEMQPIRKELGEDINRFNLYVLSDTHIGSKEYDESVVKDIINFIKNTPNTYCILLGDILDTALKNSKTDIYSETMTTFEAQRKAIELLTPIKDKIIGMTAGNHENRVWKEAGIDLSLWLAEKLGIESLYRNNGLLLNITFGKDTCGHPFIINIFGQHGAYGGGRKLGSAMNALEDLDGIVANADLYIRAHTHSPVRGSRDVYVFNHRGGLEKKTKYYFNSPSVLKYGGYAYNKGYRPQDYTPCYLSISGSSTQRTDSPRGRRALERRLKIDTIML